MSPINDYLCQSCGIVMEDCIEKPTACEKCQGPVEVTFQNWRTMHRAESASDLTDSHGFRKAFGAAEDPLCKIEMGLENDNGHGIKTFSPGQQRYYVEKICKDGDSPKLRREILRQRAQNEKDAGISVPYETM